MPARTRPRFQLKPIHLLRYGLPAAMIVPGVVLMVVGNTRHPVMSAVGLSAVTIAFLVWLTNIFARMSLVSNRDREREERSRENYARTGSWIDPETLAATTPPGAAARPRPRPESSSRATPSSSAEIEPAPEPQRATEPSPAPPRPSRPYSSPDRIRSRRSHGGGGGSGHGRRRD